MISNRSIFMDFMVVTKQMMKYELLPFLSIKEILNLSMVNKQAYSIINCNINSEELPL